MSVDGISALLVQGMLEVIADGLCSNSRALDSQRVCQAALLCF